MDPNQQNQQPGTQQQSPEDRFDQQGGRVVDGGNPQGDGLILGKFKTQDDLIAAYKELEAKLGAGGGKPTDTPPQDPPANTGSDQPADSPAGVDFDAIGKEIAETGTLSPESRQKMIDAGIPAPLVDSHIRGVKAEIAEFQAAVHEAAGGEENWKRIQAWATANLSQEERDKLSRQASVSKEGAQLAVMQLRQKFEAANGRDPNLVSGGAGGVEVGYQSTAEMTADMKDPRYKKDPAFRRMVERKLEATTAF